MVTIDQSINTCAMQSLKPLTFPCDASAIELVSLGIACGVSSLLFVWFLIKQVGAIVAHDRFLEIAVTSHHARDRNSND
jgi:hypothetical protein